MSRTARLDRLERRCHLTAVSFDVDSELSFLTISARVRHDDFGSVKLNSQGEGLDTAQLDGTLKADITRKGVKFSGGSEIRAIEHEGDFDPGDADAAFAIDGKLKKLITLAEVEAAVRDLELDITESSRKAIVGQKRRFLIRNAEMEATSGTIDYKLDSKFGDADGSESFAGQKTDLNNGFGRVTGKKGQRIITIPVLVEYKRELENDVSGTFVLKGQIVGRETTTQTAQAASFSTKTIEAKERDKADRVATLLAL